MKPRLPFYGLVMSAVAICLLVCSPASAANRSTAQLRRTFGQVFLSLRIGGASAACSLATAQGRISIIEEIRGEEHYLPSTTCPEAFSGWAAKVKARWEACDREVPDASQFAPTINSAVIRVNGNHATVQLVNDRACGYVPSVHELRLFEGLEAVKYDPLGTSHWMRKHGRWLFDDRPTGTYSPVGRKAAAMLRAALDGSVVTAVPTFERGFTLSVGFCATGAIHTEITIPGNAAGATTEAGPWYVTGGSSSEPPFDPHGNAQGRIILERAWYIVAIEWDVSMVEGKLVVNLPPSESGAQLTVVSGAARC
jgi:hypothetical protein